MLRAFVIAGATTVALGLSSPAAAQQSLSTDSVVEICEQVAESERRGSVDSHPLRGQCIEATVGFIAASIAALPLNEVDPLFSTLVIELTELVLNAQCLPESEVAQAIEIVGGAVTDPDQSAEVLLIAGIVETCDIFAVAAVVPGLQASAN